MKVLKFWKRSTDTAQVAPIDPAALDYSMFDHGDFLNFILQRSDVIHDVPKSGRMIRRWSDGDGDDLIRIAVEKNSLLAQRAVAEIGREYDELREVIARFSPRSIADIGCGYAIFELFAARETNADLHLIDIERNDHRHFGFNKEASAYSDLEKAVQFLTANGVQPTKIHKMNPETQDLETMGQIDLAVSFLACGFHFPIDTYMSFFTQKVRPGGGIILDLREAKKDRQIAELSRLGKVDILSRAENRVRVLITKGDQPA